MHPEYRGDDSVPELYYFNGPAVVFEIVDNARYILEGCLVAAILQTPAQNGYLVKSVGTALAFQTMGNIPDSGKVRRLMHFPESFNMLQHIADILKRQIPNKGSASILIVSRLL